VLFAEEEQKWLRGEDVERYIKVDDYEFWMPFSQDRLRYRPERNEIETSRGAYVSVKAGQVLYKMIKAGKPVHGHSIDGYTVIGYNGELKIGCHIIKAEEIERFAKVMNWD